MRRGLHHENANATSLGVIRAAVFTLWLVLFLSDWPGLLAPPRELFVVRGVWRLVPAGWFETIFSQAWADVFPWVFVPIVAAAALGLRPYRVWAALALVFILVFDGWTMGLSSFVYHSRALALLMAGVLAFAPAADGFSPGRRVSGRREDSDYRFPVLFMLVAGLFCYAMIGTHRLINGDYRVFSNPDVMRAWMLVRASAPTSTDFDWGRLVANSPGLLGLAQVGFFICTLLEVASPACLRWRGFAFGWLVFFTVFHFVSLVLLNIFFWENSVLLWLLFLPLGTWFPLRRSQPKRPDALDSP